MQGTLIGFVAGLAVMFSLATTGIANLGAGDEAHLEENLTRAMDKIDRLNAQLDQKLNDLNSTKSSLNVLGERHRAIVKKLGDIQVGEGSALDKALIKLDALEHFLADIQSLVERSRADQG